MKFSIVTVTFNAEHTVRKTLQSIISQSYLDYETIIVDGCSTDETLKVVKEFNPDKILSEPDRGIFDAMNKGLRLAEGDYIQFLNAGDFFFNRQVLQNLYKNITNENFPDLVYTDSVEIDHQANKKFYKKARPHSLIFYNMIAHHQAMFYRLKKVKALDLFYDESYKKAGDYAFTSAFISKGATVKKFKFPSVYYDLDGVSQNEYYKDNSEIIRVKKEILHMSKIHVRLVIFLNSFFNFLKRNFRGLYNFLRYRKPYE